MTRLGRATLHFYISTEKAIMRSFVLCFAFIAGILLSGCDSTTTNSNQPLPPADPVNLLVPVSQVEVDSLMAIFGCEGMVSIDSSDVASGVLTDADCFHFDAESEYDARLDYFAFKLDGGAGVQIDVKSDSLDMFVHLFNAEGYLVDEDDDSGEGPLGTDAQILHSLTDAGLYALGVTTFPGEATLGSYTVQVFTSEARPHRP